MSDLLRSGWIWTPGSLLLLEEDAFAQMHDYGWGMGPGMMNWGWFGAVMMGVVWIGTIIAIILLIRWLLAVGARGAHRGEESPLDILKKRYARGEIDKEEFEEKRKDLS